jgi:hypothetical protein
MDTRIIITVLLFATLSTRGNETDPTNNVAP